MNKKSVRKKTTGNTASPTVAPTAATPAQAAAPPAKATLGQVPEGTETEHWRIMSAKIAFEFWKHPSREVQPAELYSLYSTWEDAAEEYRRIIRCTLRKAELEEIKFRETVEASSLETDSNEWRVKSARIAWLLWLSINRTSQRIPMAEELKVWGEESKGFRAFVRAGIKNLAGIGYRMA